MGEKGLHYKNNNNNNKLNSWLIINLNDIINNKTQAIYCTGISIAQLIAFAPELMT